MIGNGHAGFGRGSEETERSKARHRASGLPYGSSHQPVSTSRPTANGRIGQALCRATQSTTA